MAEMVAGDALEVCPVCDSIVKDDDKGLQCDGFCNKWHHSLCVNISLKSYKKIIDLKDDVKWLCGVCSDRLTTMRNQASCDVKNEEEVNLRELVQNLINVVKDVVNDNAAINQKLDNVIQGEHRLCLISDLRLDSNRRQIDVSTQTELIGRVSSTGGSIDRNRLDADTVTGGLNASTSVSVTELSRLGTCGAVNSEDILPRRSAISAVVQNGPNVLDLSGDDLPALESRPNEWHKVKPKKAVRRRDSATNRVVVGNSVPRSTKGIKSTPRQLVVGTCESANDIVAGEKRAWFYLGKVKSGTSAENIKNLITSKLPGIEPTVEKLESKGVNASFKISVKFSRKDELMDGSIWPKNVIVKRFLFKKTNQKPAD